MKELVTCYPVMSFILGESKHYDYDNPQDLTNYFWTYAKFSLPS